MLLAHVYIGGQSLSASDFIEVDDETPAFNKWTDPGDDLIVVNEGFNNNRNNEEEEDDEYPMNETPPQLIDALGMARRLHLLSSTERPQLYSLISLLDSQLSQLFIDSKVLKQTTIDDFLLKNE